MNEEVGAAVGWLSWPCNQRNALAGGKRQERRARILGGENYNEIKKGDHEKFVDRMGERKLHS